MPAHDRSKLARDCYRAYETGDRRVVEAHLSDDFTFYGPADVGLDRRRTSSAAGRTPRRSPPSTSGGWSSPATRSL